MAEYDRLLAEGMEEYTIDGKKVSTAGRLQFLSGEIAKLEARLAQLSRRGSRYRKGTFL